MPERIFPLLCPVIEYDWIPQWRCEIIYTQSGFSELDCVFSTDFKDSAGAEIWVVCIYEKNRQIGFVKTGTHCTTRYSVSLEPNQNYSTIQWTQEITSLSSEGDMIVDNMTEKVYQERMEYINNLMEFYLINGTALHEKWI